MPELLDTFPVLNLTTSKNMADHVGVLGGERLIADVIIEFTNGEFAIFLYIKMRNK